MGRERRRVGIAGERHALLYLKKKGYRLLEKNFRTPFGEIDIITRYKDVFVFVEVKARTTSSLGPPYLSVTKSKERHIIKNALYYLKIKGALGANWRIDIASVKLNYDNSFNNIEIIENAVEDNYI